MFCRKKTEKGKIVESLLNNEVKNLEDLGCPKVEDFVDEEMWIRSSYPFKHKTTFHCAERKAKSFDNWIMHQLEL